ncbi:SDR family NAD(P)-dependent oxidoreductase [Pedococcus sp. 2YAF34]|uniref:SDR family NAD(P)-dependent oxidoreductase n=1 Tax=Pedococcus sp. 2YAF34 TaxID=3233032 RepID=UPI003F98E04D
MTNPTSPATPGSAALPGSDSATARTSPGAAGRPLAVVTGASSGIGAATARQLAAVGYEVVCAARRSDRVEALAAEIGGRAVTCDVSDAADVARLADVVGDRLDVLVNNAGGALGLAPATQTDVADWRGMFESNVVGTLQVTQALLPALVASGAGTIVNVGSIAGRTVYEGGSGYTAAKHAVAVLTETLRLELVDQPVRVTEVAPGMVRTEEFSLTRFGGDQERADKVYEGVKEPLVAEDVAEAVVWMVQRPAHVNIDLLVIKPRAQAAAHKVHRES